MFVFFDMLDLCVICGALSSNLMYPHPTPGPTALLIPNPGLCCAGPSRLLEHLIWGPICAQYVSAAEEDQVDRNRARFYKVRIFGVTLNLWVLHFGGRFGILGWICSGDGIQNAIEFFRF